MRINFLRDSEHENKFQWRQHAPSMLLTPEAPKPMFIDAIDTSYLRAPRSISSSFIKLNEMMSSTW